MMNKGLQKIGETAFHKIEKINSELLTMTYGALIVQLLKDYEDVHEVNKQLDKMGYKIGIRLIDEYMSKSGAGSCKDFEEAMESISKVGLKMFLGITGTVSNWNKDRTQCSLTLSENPLNDFVELPDKYQDLWYSNILCGVIRGALEVVQMKVDCYFVRDVIRGDDTTEIKVILKEYLKEVAPEDDD